MTIANQVNEALCLYMPCLVATFYGIGKVFARCLGGSLRILIHLYLVRMNLISLYRLEIKKEEQKPA